MSRLALGSMNWGTTVARRQCFAHLDLALAAGVNLVDTAAIYPVPATATSCGVSEAIIGDWLQSRNCRSQIVLATKAAIRRVKGGSCHDNSQSKLSLQQQLDGSLSRLKSDYVDLYQLHWPQRRVPFRSVRNFHSNWATDSSGIEELVEQLDRLVSAGKILAVGLCNETTWGLLRFLRVGEINQLPWRVVALQNSYSVLNRRDQYHLSEALLREEVGYLAYSVLAGGQLSGKYLGGQIPQGSRMSCWHGKGMSRFFNQNADRAVAAYQQLAQENHLQLSEMMLAFTLSESWVTAVIAGASTIDQLQSALAATELQLSDELRKKIESVYCHHPDPLCS